MAKAIYRTDLLNVAIPAVPPAQRDAWGDRKWPRYPRNTEFQARLVRKGWEVLGQGAYGTAYGKKGSKLVWKIGHNGFRDGYWHYVNAIIGGAVPNSSILPRVKRIYVATNMGQIAASYNGAFTYAVLIERLEYTLNAAESAKRGYREWRKLWDLFSMHMIGRGKDFISESDRRRFYAVRKATKVAHNLDRNSLKSVRKAVATVGTYAGMDMHGGNWMFRKNGDIVMTDPFSGLGFGDFEQSFLTDATKVNVAFADHHKPVRARRW